MRAGFERVDDMPTDPTIPADEAERIAELQSYGLLDTPPEAQFDRIVDLARALFDTPISAISLVDQDRQWFKARTGLDVNETGREQSFCAHAMRHGDVFVVPDAREDARFADFANVQGEPHIRFYAGAPLRSPSGQPLGALCVISRDPRGDFSEEDRRRLSILANIVGNEMELKRQAAEANRVLEERELALREAHYKLRNSVEFASLLAEVQSSETGTEQLGMIAMAAWRQYSEAGGVLTAAIKSLRTRLSKDEYAALLSNMPGFLL